MKKITVAIFQHPGRRSVRLAAYTLWYSKDWAGCCEHQVAAANGTDAKRVAKIEHRKQCMAERESKP